MKLGILVNTDKNLDHIVGITKSAISKGHTVSIFNMDDGTKLLVNPAFTSLRQIKGVTIAFCDHSAKHKNISSEGIPADITCGSQFDNANMNHDTDKVIVL
jgi:predicted peroxiredoxin